MICVMVTCMACTLYYCCAATSHFNTKHGCVHTRCLCASVSHFMYICLAQEDALPDYSTVLFLACLELYKFGGMYGDLTLFHINPLQEVKLHSNRFFIPLMLSLEMSDSVIARRFWLLYRVGSVSRSVRPEFAVSQHIHRQSYIPSQ